jgi:hypothetical protein
VECRRFTLKTSCKNRQDENPACFYPNLVAAELPGQIQEFPFGKVKPDLSNFELNIESIVLLLIQ